MKKKLSRGFGLLELLIVLAIVGLLLLHFLSNYRNQTQGKPLVERWARLFASDLRLAQSHALSGKAPGIQFNADIRCGYGLRLVESYPAELWTTYARRLEAGDCSAASALPYFPGDETVVTRAYDNTFNSYVEIKSNIDTGGSPRFTLYFESLTNKLYIHGSPTLPYPATVPPGSVPIVSFRLKKAPGVTCLPETCVSVCVSYSGRIEVIDGDACPVP